jgi:hypothetical protein
MSQRSSKTKRIAAIRQLVGLLQDALPRVRLVDKSEMPRFVSALGLARAVRLLEAMLLMNDNDLRDVAALPLRPLFEVWLTAMYCFLGGDAALIELQGAHRRQVSQIPSKALQRALDRVASEDIEMKRVQWEQLAQKVGRLAAEQGDFGAEDRIQQFYDFVYRGESLASIHGGIGTVGGHARLIAGNKLMIRPKRADAKSSIEPIVVGGVLVAMLASHLLNAYDLDDGRFDAIAKVITREPRRG